MKHRIKPTGKMRAVSIYASGKSINFAVLKGSTKWDSKGCNRALSDCARYRIRVAKGEREDL